MRQIIQTLDEIQDSLSPIPSIWRDEHAGRVIDLLDKMFSVPLVNERFIEAALDEDFEIGTTAVRLFLDISADAYRAELTSLLGKGGIGVKRFRTDPAAYMDALNRLGLASAISRTTTKDFTWVDLLTERLKGGRGSAIKGQQTGLFVENFTEEIVREVFGAGHYHLRCRFQGPNGKNEKCDFAIPSKEKPQILIEAKGYLATGSKQTDILGDIEKIIMVKRTDIPLILITDGITWRSRTNDLRKLIQKQNDGEISRIYTIKMAREFRKDLETLKAQFGL